MLDWRDVGISTHRSTGKEKVRCPECDGKRGDKRDKSLSLDHEKGVWNCHYCGWSGSLHEGRRPSVRYDRPQYKPTPATPHAKLIDYFNERQIQAHTVKHFEVETRERNGLGACMAIPFRKNNEIVNVKYRTRDKKFQQETGAEPTFFNRDTCLIHKEIFVTEGEIDAMTLWQEGYPNVVSVPNGAGSNLDFLGNDGQVIDNVEKWILAGDADEAGERLQQEFIRRVGADRCYRVVWPDGCKDANEVLCKLGGQALKQALSKPAPVPIEGAWEVSQLVDDLKRLYKYGRPTGLSTGWANLDPYYKVREGDWTMVLGIPGSGKSSFMMAMTMNMAREHDWQFAVYPPENLPPEEYLSQLTEIYTGKPLSADYGLTEKELDEAIEFLDRHFIIINPAEDQRNLRGILGIAKSLVLRRGIKGLIIDPWNELEQPTDAGMTETQFVTQALIQFRHFCRIHKVHGWIVVHPTKLRKGENGKFGVPTLYDASGSSAWYNKSDVGLVLHREMQSDVLEVHIQKCRKKWCGKTGVAYLRFDRSTGRYSEHEESLEPEPVKQKSARGRYWEETEE